MFSICYYKEANSLSNTSKSANKLQFFQVAIADTEILIGDRPPHRRKTSSFLLEIALLFGDIPPLPIASITPTVSGEVEKFL